MITPFLQATMANQQQQQQQQPQGWEAPLGPRAPIMTPQPAQQPSQPKPKPVIITQTTDNDTTTKIRETRVYT